MNIKMNKEKIISGDFIDGSAVVVKKENLVLWRGLKFENGNIRWFKVQYLGDFSCGLAPIDLSSAFGYINRQGEFQIQPHYLGGEEFIDDVALICDISNTYLMDVNGEVIKKFDTVYNTNSFHQGFALIHEISDDGECKRDAIINKRGEFVIPFDEEMKIGSPYDLNNPNDFYSDGLIRTRDNKSFGFNDLDNNVIINPKYRNAYRFSEGLAMVDKNRRCGFIDTAGKEFIPLEFDSAESFSEGLAAVRLGDKWGCIDKTSEIIIPFEFDALGTFHNGEIEFMIENKWGIMNKKMEVIVEPKYDSIEPFKDGISSISLNNKPGVIDRSGNNLFGDFIIGCQYLHMFN